MDDEMDCTLTKYNDDMHLGEEEDILEGRSAILSSWRNSVKLSENKSKVLHLDWSQSMQQDRLSKSRKLSMRQQSTHDEHTSSDMLSERLEYDRQTQVTAKKIVIRYREKKFSMVMVVKHWNIGFCDIYIPVKYSQI